MWTTRTKRRFRIIWKKSINLLWVCIIIPIWEIFKCIFGFVWEEYASKILGDKVAEMIQDWIEAVSLWLPNFILWASKHPVDISIIWFFMVLSFILIRVYSETRDRKDINVDKEILEYTFGHINFTGFLITNNSEEDLQDCRIYLSEIDNNKQYRESNGDYLKWGARNLGKQNYTVDIPNTESNAIYINQIGDKLIALITREKFIGRHKLEFTFNADAVSGKKTIYIYCTIAADIIKATDNTEELPKIILLKAEK